MLRSLGSRSFIAIKLAAMADYSHFSSTTVANVSLYLAAGFSPTDEMYLEAILRLDPSFVTEPQLVALKKELDRKISRRGRPSLSGVTRDDIAAVLLGSEHADVPQVFLQALAERLSSGKRSRNLDQSRTDYRKSRKRDRDSFIRCIYEDIYALLGDAPTCAHPVLGKIDVPTGKGSRSEKALLITQNVLRNRLGEDPPSLGTMMNIISAGF